MKQNIEKYIRAVFEENCLIESSQNGAMQLGVFNSGNRRVVVSLHLGKKTCDLNGDGSSIITARTNRFFEKEPFYIGEHLDAGLFGREDPDGYTCGRCISGVNYADRIFGRFVREADLSELKDTEFAEMVSISRAERLAEKPWFDRTYRFLSINHLLKQREEGFGAERPEWCWHGPRKLGRGFPYNDGLPHHDGYEYLDFVLTTDKTDLLYWHFRNLEQSPETLK